jgi:hypothetical protein
MRKAEWIPTLKYRILKFTTRYEKKLQGAPQDAKSYHQTASC